MEEFDDTSQRQSLASNQVFQRSFSNLQYHPLNNNFGNNYINYHQGNHGSPRHIILSQNVNSPVIRRPSFPTHRQLFGGTSISYRPPVSNYQLRGFDFRQPIYPTPSHPLRQPCHMYRPIPSLHGCNFNPGIQVQYQTVPTRILQKPTVKSNVPMSCDQESLSSLNPATITVSIPSANLKDCPANMMDIVSDISMRTKTHIFAFDGGRGQNAVKSQVKYCIYGKWRHCYEAGKLLWKKLTKPHTAYVHESWLSFIYQKISRSNESLRNLYPVDIKHVPSMKVLTISGHYYDVLKLQKELVLRQRKRVTRMSRDLLIVDYANDSGMEENDSIEILSQIKSDIDSSLLLHEQSLQPFTNSFGRSFCRNSAFNSEGNVNGSPTQSSSLKATEIIKLLFGPDPTATNEIIINNETITIERKAETIVESNLIEDFGESQEAEEEEENDADVEPSIQFHDKVKPQSIIFIPGQDIPVFSCELEPDKDEEKEFQYPEIVKSSTPGNKTSDFEVIESVLNDDENIVGEDDLEQVCGPFNIQPINSPNRMSDEYDVSGDLSIEVASSVLDGIDKLEEVEFLSIPI